MHNFIKYFSVVFIIFLIVLIPVVLYFVTNLRVDNQSIESPIANLNSKPPSPALVKKTQLNKVVEKHFENNKNYAVVIKNFKTGEEYSFNDEKIFDSASLYKLWVHAVAMQQLRDGEIEIDEKISGDKNKIDEILNPSPESNEGDEQSESIEEKEPDPISMEVGTAIDKMITESDNYAAIILSNKVDFRNIEKFLDDYGFDNSNYDSPPQTTAKDIAKYFEMLYEGKIIDEKASGEMLDVLKRQTLNDRIPKYLPEEVEVAHKTGELLGNKHDAGIVYSENGDYMIIVLSKTSNEAIAAEKIASFSDEVFIYFQEI